MVCNWSGIQFTTEMLRQQKALLTKWSADHKLNGKVVNLSRVNSLTNLKTHTHIHKNLHIHTNVHIYIPIYLHRPETKKSTCDPSIDFQHYFGRFHKKIVNLAFTI